MRTGKIIHVEYFGATGLLLGTHKVQPPNMSKKKHQRRRSTHRAYRVLWFMEYPYWPAGGWSSMADFETTLEIIFHAKD